MKITHSNPSTIGLLLLLAPLGLAFGCNGGQAIVSGTVTVSGQPMTKGEIVFSPANGGTPVGSPIVAGKYSAKMLPGERTVLITETLDVEPILSTEEMQRRAEAGAKPAVPPQSKITESTPGNNKTVTLAKGVQTIDFPLLP